MKAFCEPAKLYLFVSVIFLVFAVFHQISALTLLVKGVFILLWTMILNWLCSKGFSGLAWIIVVLPFVVLFMTTFTTMDLMHGGGGYEGFVGPKLSKAQKAEKASSIAKAAQDRSTERATYQAALADKAAVANKVIADKVAADKGAKYKKEQAEKWADEQRYLVMYGGA